MDGTNPPPGFRIRQVVQELSRAGGVETVAMELQRCWQASGVPSEVLAATVGPDVPPDMADQVRFVLPERLGRLVPTRGRGRYLGRATMVPAFTVAATVAARRAEQRRPAVVLSHGDSLTADAVVIHAVNAENLRCKREDGEWKWMLNPMHAWVAARDRFVLGGARARRYIAVSQRVVDELARHHGIPRAQMAVIPNGTDLDRFSPDGPGAGLRDRFAIPAAAPLLLFVGHEFTRKGLAQAIDALTHPGCEAAHLVVVGSGDAGRYGKQAAQRGLQDRVHFAGPCADLPPVYRDADAFVLPTAYETFSLVCMEALACGVPVIATRVGGIEDYLRDGENGFAVERDGAAIAAVLAPLLRDPARLRQLGAAARATAGQYGWPAVSRRYAAVLGEIWQEKYGRADLPSLRLASPKRELYGSRDC